jgi:hypothetical protein
MSPAQAAAPPAAAKSAASSSDIFPLAADAVNAMNATTLKAELEKRGLRYPTAASITKERETTYGLATTNTSDVLQPINAAKYLLRTSSLVVAVAARADTRTSGPIGTGMKWHDVAPDAAPVPPLLLLHSIIPHLTRITVQYPTKLYCTTKYLKRSSVQCYKALNTQYYTVFCSTVPYCIIQYLSYK